MSTTTMDLDDELVAEAMRVSGLANVQDVVDLAMRRLLDSPQLEQDSA